MNSYTKLFKNSIIFAIGNLGSKLVSILLVPLYTYYLSTGEYGTVDLIITTTNMLVPVVSLSMAEASLRFAMDKSVDKKSTITNAIYIAAIGLILSLIAFPILSYLNVFGEYLALFYGYLFFNIVDIILAQYLRGIGYSRAFAANGIILTLSTGLLNILFIVNFGMGVNGYLISLILANLISIIYLAFNIRFWEAFNLKLLDKELQKELIKYSIPLIPNSLMWSAINSSSRYFILFFIGVQANGLFAVASKIPLVINIASQIFSQAWQISAIEEAESNTSKDFYTNIFKYLSVAMFLSVSLVLLILKPLFGFAFSSDYYMAWQSTPFLLLGAVFSSFSNILGATYIANKQTIGVFRTSIWGGLLSLVANAVLIPTIGLVGAGISSCMSFALMFYLRFKDTQKFNNMKINWKVFNGSLGIVLLQTSILLLNLNYIIEVLINLGLLIIFLFVNKEFVLFVKDIIIIGLRKIIKK